MVTRTVVGGEKLNLHTMKPGELAGAMGFVDGIARSVTLHAIGDAVVYSLERDAFETLVEQHPRLVYHIMRAVTRTAHTALVGVNRQVEELTNYIIKQHGRYWSFPSARRQACDCLDAISLVRGQLRMARIRL